MKTRTSGIAFACIGVCSLFHASQIEALAQNAGSQPQIAIQTARGFPGETILLPINARRLTNVAAMQFDVNYSSARVSVAPPVSGLPSGPHRFLSREVSPGIHRILIFSNQNSPLTNRGTLAYLPVSVPANEYVGSGPIPMAGAVLAGSGGIAMKPISTVGGNVFVAPVFRQPEGNVSFFLPSEVDQLYIIQASTNLVDWMNLSTNSSPSSFLDLLDPDLTIYPQRFYRANLAR